MRIFRFKKTIRFRLVMTYLLVTIAAFIVVGFSVSAIVEEYLVSQRTQSEISETERIAIEAADLFTNNNSEKLYKLAIERAQDFVGRVLILDNDAVVQVDSASQLNGYQLPYREIIDVLINKKQHSYAFHQIAQTSAVEERGNISFILQSSKTWVVYYVVPITVSGQINGALVYSSSIQNVVDSVNNIGRQTFLIFLAVSLAVAIISMVLSGWLTKPIVELTQAIRHMGRSGYGNKVQIRGSGEIAEMGDAFNRMNEKLENHDKLRDEFVSNASHELKTPMASMKILVESMLYQENPDPKMMQEFLKDVDHEIDRLTSIINDLLTLVQEDRTDTKLKTQKVKLDALVSRVADRLKPISLNKNIAVQTRLYPVVMEGDSLRLEQVVSNLIDNAIKYTDPAGKIFVELRQDASEAVLSVRDTGIGIPNEEIAHLFDRFYRVDKARSRGTGGTGLGLSIVDKLVRLHGGYIEVRSQEGEGSEFIVHLPLVQGDE